MGLQSFTSLVWEKEEKFYLLPKVWEQLSHVPFSKLDVSQDNR